MIRVIHIGPELQRARRAVVMLSIFGLLAGISSTLAGAPYWAGAIGCAIGSAVLAVLLAGNKNPTFSMIAMTVKLVAAFGLTLATLSLTSGATTTGYIMGKIVYVLAFGPLR